MSKRIDQLHEAVEVMHHCKAQHEQSFSVVEIFGAQTVWGGVVESFAIAGHPEANRCYAWSFLDGTETRYVTVLEIPPVESPQTAVRAYIVADAKNQA